ncbi:MAG: MFS transporter, partial [Clostridia bacterium]|nr:MFS transporter [Clostridia bacterium]
VMLPIFVVEFFGNKSFEKLIGFFTAASTAGFAIGSPLGNVCYDIFGDYKLAFLIFGILMIIVTVSMQFVLKATRKDRKIILEALEQQETTEETLAPAVAQEQA